MYKIRKIIFRNQIKSSQFLFMITKLIEFKKDITLIKGFNKSVYKEFNKNLENKALINSISISKGDLEMFLLFINRTYGENHYILQNIINLDNQNKMIKKYIKTTPSIYLEENGILSRICLKKSVEDIFNKLNWNNRWRYYDYSSVIEEKDIIKNIDDIVFNYYKTQLKTIKLNQISGSKLQFNNPGEQKITLRSGRSIEISYQKNQHESFGIWIKINGKEIMSIKESYDPNDFMIKFYDRKILEAIEDLDYDNDGNILEIPLRGYSYMED